MNNKFLYPKGSEWRKWDLHLHTPASFDYKNRSITNAQIITALKDNNIAVAAITDHHIIDVIRITELINLGEENGITIFPGIELRSELGGSESIHFIGIFSNKANLTELWTKIQSECGLMPSEIVQKGDDKVYCDLEDTCKLIKELGGIVTIHAGGKSNSIESISNNQEFKKFLKAKIVKENIDILELGDKRDEDDCNNIIFPSIAHRLPMVLGSDNHNAAKYVLKECCWIKADPTFNGLKQIIYEPQSRVFLGKEPQVITRVENNRTKYIKELKVSCIESYDEKNGEWFKDVSIEFNKELVAIIGNKGSGKSALSDICGVLGHSHNVGNNHANLTFLNGKSLKFRKKGYAQNFEAQLIWESDTGESAKVCLDHDVDLNETEKVKYLPQNYFELITNDLDANGFENTLKDVIFLHIPTEERLGFASFDELEKAKIKGIETDINSIKSEVNNLSGQIIRLEHKSNPDYINKIKNQITDKQKELDEHLENKPLEVSDPSKSDTDEENQAKQLLSAELNDLNTKYLDLENQININRESLVGLVQDKEYLTQIKGEVQRLSTNFVMYKDQNKEKFNKYGLDIERIINFNVTDEPIKEKIKIFELEIIGINKKLLTLQLINTDNNTTLEQKEQQKNESLLVQQFLIREKINTIKKDLSKPEKDFQEYKEKLTQWETKKKSIEGDEKVISSLNYYKAEEKYLTTFLEPDLKELYENIINNSLRIFSKKKEIIALYEMFKASVDVQMKQDAEFINKFKMEINAGFRIEYDFANRFLSYINKTKSGTYRGSEEKSVNSLFTENNLLSEDGIKKILITVIDNLREDQRDEVKGTDIKRYITNQIDHLQEFYEYIFSLSYFKPIYELTLYGKTLVELSPGERGALLLVFYLMIDKEDKPLIIDQPEDNLDNKSVYEVLTHFIKIAKQRRQIIIVTHNPNLAVGADAEQIIYVNLDKKNNYKFEYKTGSIEDQSINERIVEILEGTKPAFDKRRLRYTG